MKAFWRCGLFLFNFIFFLYYIFSNVHDINVAMILLWISSHFINKIYWFFNSCLSFFASGHQMFYAFQSNDVFWFVVNISTLNFQCEKECFLLAIHAVRFAHCGKSMHTGILSIHFFFFPPVMNGSPCTETIFNETWPVSKGSTMKGFFN